MVIPIGSIVNAGAVVAGGALGLTAGRFIGEKLRDSLFQVLGFCTLLLGLKMALAATDPMLPILSSVLGVITGEALRLADLLEAAGNLCKRLLRSKNEKFTDGLVTAALIMCIGAMGLVGALEEGLGGGRTVLYSKSILDFSMALILASVYGTGVMAASVPLLIYQGGATLMAGTLAPFLTGEIKTALTATGGLIMLGIGTNLLGIKPVAVANLLPALVYALILSAVFV